MGETLIPESITEPVPRLLVSVLIGGLIGLDRAYRGRAAGFRTHILVCLASALLMLLMDYQWQLIPAEYVESIRADPMRMAQGIMTGIGFLGAGVIMQDKQIVRGLTTAASIWITSAIGIVVGMGFYSLALFGTLLTLVTLAVFNKMINVVPTLQYAWLSIGFKRHERLTQEEMVAMLEKHHTVISNFAYKLENSGAIIVYQMTLRTSDSDRFRAIAQELLTLETVQGFSLRPLGE